MSDAVDKRVVEMQFNNAQFERNIKQSTLSLANLKKSLDLSGAIKSLGNLAQAGKNFTLSGIASGVDAINNRFSAMGVIGTTVLANITNAAVNTGRQVMNALTIDPVRMGFSEYETQINAVQTILANTSKDGVKLEKVNAVLDDLNTYADKTIYNFTQMTKNIGTFTAAGVDLDTSASSIKGIANLGAVSGSTSQQVSTAMYQMSQALASGRMTLMDWNSVVNAGMGGDLFKDELMRTAKVMGVTGKQGQEMFAKLEKGEVSFRDSLSSGWITTDILTHTLQKFGGELNEVQLRSMGYTSEQTKEILELGKMATDAATKVKTFTQLFETLKESVQSGWTQSWEYIVGDFEESKAMLTKVSDTLGGIIQASSDARNEVLKFWHDNGGRTALLEAFRNLYDIISYISYTGKQAFESIIPPTTGQRITELTNRFRDFTGRIKEAIGFTDSFRKSVEKAVGAVVDPIGEAIGIAEESAISGASGKDPKAIYDTMPDWMKKWADKGAAKNIASIRHWRKSNRDLWYEYQSALTGSDLKSDIQIADAYAEMPDWMQKRINNGDQRDLENVATWRERNQKLWYAYWDAVDEATAGASAAAEEAAVAAAESAQEIEKTNKATDDVPSGLKRVTKVFKGAAAVINIFKMALGAVGDIAYQTAEAFVPAADILLTIFADLGGWLEELNNSIIQDGTFQKAVEKVMSVIRPTLDWLARFIGKSYDVGKAMHSLIQVFRQSDIYQAWSTRFKNAIQSVTDTFTNFKTKVKTFITDVSALADEFIADPKAFVDKITEKLKTMFQKPVDEAGEETQTFAQKFLQYVSEAFPSAAEFTNTVIQKIGDLIDGVIKFLTKGDGLDLEDVFDAIIGYMAVKTGIRLADLIKNISDVFENVGDFVGNIGDMFGKGDAVRGFLKTLPATIGIISLSIFVLAKSLETIGTMNFEQMKQGLIGMAGVMTEMGTFLFAVNKIKPDLKTTLSLLFGLVPIALATILLTIPLKVIGGMESEQIKQGLIGMAGVMTEMGTFLFAVNKIKPDLKTTVSLLLGLLPVAFSMILLTIPLKVIGGMESEQIKQGLIGMAGVMTEMAAFLLAADAIKPDLKTTVSLLLGLLPVAFSMILLTIPLKVIGGMESEQMKQGLIGMAGVMTEMAAFLLAADAIKPDLKTTVSLLLGLLPVAFSMILLTIPLKVIGDMDAEQMKQGLIGMAGVMTEMGLFLAAVDKVGVKVKSGAAVLVSMLGMSIFIIAFANALDKLKDIPTERIDTTSKSLALILGSLGGVLAILSKIPLSGALKAGAILLGTIAGLGLVMNWLVDLFGDTIIDKTEKMGGALGPLGEGLAAFAEKTKGINIDQVSAASGAIGIISEMAKEIPNSGGLLAWLVGDNDIGKFGENLGVLADGLVSFATKTADINITGASGVIGVFQSIVDLAKSAMGVKFEDTYLFAGFFKLFDYYDPSELETTANTLVNGFITPFQNGMRTGVVTAANQAMSIGVSMIRSYYNDFYNAGYYDASGIANGMRAGGSLVSSAANAIGNIMLSSTRKTLDEHSPSKKGFDIGKNFDVGIANGVTAFIGMIGRSASSVGERMIDSSKAILGRLMDVVSSDMTFSPTIRPVIDMTDVNSGIGAINGIFGRAYFMGDTFRRNAAEVHRGSTSQNKDVVNALDVLNNKIDTLSQAVTNMQIVLDTGELVGRTSAKYDKQLGIIAGRKERGN